MKRHHARVEKRGWRGALSLMSVDEPNIVRGRISTLARAAWIVVAALTLAVFIAALPARYLQLVHAAPAIRAGLEHFDISRGFYATYTIAFDAVYVLGSIMIATLIFLRRPRDRMVLFVSLFLVTFAASTSTELESLSADYHMVDVFSTLMGAIGYTCLNGLFYLFPDGRFVPRWTWIVMLFIVLGQVPFSLPRTSPFSSDNWPTLLLLSVLLGSFGTAVFAQIYRYRRASDTVQRQQTKWVVYGATAAVVVMFAVRTPGTISPSLLHNGSLYTLVRGPALNIGWSLIPLSIGIAILRHRLWDIDVLINRTLVYGTLTTCVGGLYVLVVGYLGVLLGTDGNLLISLVAAGIVAVLFAPLRDRLQYIVNRLMYGERDEPYAVLSRLGERLEAALEPEAVLPTIVQTVQEALRLTYAAIVFEEGKEPVAESGMPAESPLRLPLVYQAEKMGELILASRAPGEEFSPADRRLLEDLTRQAGIAVRAVRLTVDLQRSRERLVTTREEERRRLRRDFLHDGLGPILGGLPLKLDIAGDLMEHDPATAHELLRNLKAQSQDAVADIRRLVYALRPPALDDLGMAGAIRETAAQYEANGTRISVQTPEELPPLPAAVEVAAYRIVQEALTNDSRHAAAGECAVRIMLDEESGTAAPGGHRRRMRPPAAASRGRGPHLDARAGRGARRDLRDLITASERHNGACLAASRELGGMSVERIRVLIADDHPFFRDGLRVLLEATTDTELAGEAIDGNEVVALAAELKPDVILMDLRMPEPGGIEATRKILSTTPDTGILVVTMVEEDDSVFAAMRAGARGYLLKGADRDEMLAAIRAVARGEAVFGPGIARRLIRYFASPPQASPARTSLFPELTDREREILNLIAAGRNNQEIAESLYLSLKTVRNYVSNIFTKLQVADRAQAIIRARKAGLGQSEPSKS